MPNFLVQPKNFSQFWHKNSKIYGFRPFFLDFLIKIMLFTLKKLFFTMKDAQSFVKISLLETFLDF